MFKHTLPIMLLGLALSSTVDAAPHAYGPIKDQDTLWSISEQLRPDDKATVQQTMLALYYKNPQAFASNNINALMKGAVLKAPSSAETRRYQRLAALREARKHNHFWKRGVDLPRTTPPPIPTLKERSSTKRTKPVVKAVKASSYAETPKTSSRRLVRLQAQLQAVETKNQQLTAELQALQAKQTKGKSNPTLDGQVKKLKIELQELTSVLDQKDNHIKTLQASLKNASETIKSQHADNMRLYDKLKAVSPSSVPVEPRSEGKSELKLSTVEAATAAVTTAAASKTAAEIAKEPNTANSTTTVADNKPETSNSNGNSKIAATENKNAVAQSVWADQQKPAASTQEAESATESSANKIGAPEAIDNKAAQTNTPNSSATTQTSEPLPLAATLASPSSTTSKIETAAISETAAKPESISPAATAKINTETAEKADAKPAAQAVDSKTTEAAVKPNAATTEAATIKVPSNEQTASFEPANDVKSSSSIPVSQMLAQAGNQGSAHAEKPDTSAAQRGGVSPLALAVALISLLFILALVWRAFLQHREMRHLEQEEARVAERMRKRLEDNQSSVATSATLVEHKDADSEPNTEIKF